MLSNIKYRTLFPWVLTVQLVLAGFAFSTFFTGTHSIFFAPSILCLLGFSLFALFPNVTKEIKIPKSAVAGLLCVYTLYVLASVFWSTVPYVSLLFAIFFCIPFFTFIVIQQTNDPLLWSRIHVVAILAVFCALSFWAVIQFIFYYEAYGPRISHPMLNPNSLAGIFNMAIIPLMALFFYARKNVYVVLCLVLLAYLYAGLLMTQSRAGIAFEAVALLVFFTVLWRHPAITMQKMAMIFAVLVIVPIMIDLVHVDALDKNLTRLFHDSTQRSMNDRAALLWSTWEMVKDSPWLGTGLSTFYFVYPAYRMRHDRSDGFFAHVDPLQFWAEMGILAPLLFYGVLTAILWRTVLAVRATAKNSSLRLEIMAPFCALLAIALHAHMTFHLYILAMLFPIAFLLSYWYAATEKALGDQKRIIMIQTRGQRFLIVGIVALFIGGTSVCLTKAAAGIYYTEQAAKHLANGDVEKGKRTLDFVDLAGLDSYYRPYQLQANWRMNEMLKRKNEMSFEDKKKLYDEALDYLETAESYATTYTSIQSEKARLYFMAHEEIEPNGLEMAESLLLETIEKNPLLWDARLGLFRIYKQQGYTKKALEVLEEGRKWPMPKGPFMANVMVEMARMYKGLGDQRRHDRLMNEAYAWAARYGKAKPRR